MENNELYGLVLYKGEREELYKTCIEFDIPILYQRLFDKNEPHHMLWGFNKKGIGLVGTLIMRHLSHDKKVLYGVAELKRFFETIKNKI